MMNGLDLVTMFDGLSIPQATELNNRIREAVEKVYTDFRQEIAENGDCSQDAELVSVDMEML